MRKHVTQGIIKMRFVIFYCILFWDAAPRQPDGDLRQYVFKKECYETKADSKKELRKTLRLMKDRKYQVMKIDTLKN